MGFVEEERVLSDDIEKLTNDLRTLKILRGDNKMSLKSIFNNMIKGVNDVNYSDHSLVEINIELNRLGIAYENFKRKHWYKIDEKNWIYINEMAAKKIEMEKLDFKAKVIWQYLQKRKIRKSTLSLKKGDDLAKIDSIFQRDERPGALKS